MLGEMQGLNDAPQPPPRQCARMRVVIIGGGWSGIYTAKQLLEQGVPPEEIVVLEKREALGGVWRLDPTRKHPSVFEGTSTTSSRVFTQAGDSFFPRGTEFVPHETVLEYLQGYADEYNVSPLIRYGAQVMSVVKDGDSGHWTVKAAMTPPSGQATSSPEATADTHTHAHAHTRTRTLVYTCEWVVVCSGANAQPRDEGSTGPIEGFTGEIMHSGQYLNPLPFHRKNVVLLGGGETAADLALEIGSTSKTTAVSCASGINLIPKAGYFLPFMEKMVPLDSVSSWLRLMVAPTTINTVYSPLGFFQLQFGTYGHGLWQWLGPDAHETHTHNRGHTPTHAQPHTHADTDGHAHAHTHTHTAESAGRTAQCVCGTGRVCACGGYRSRMRGDCHDHVRVGGKIGHVSEARSSTDGSSSSGSSGGNGCRASSDISTATDTTTPNPTTTTTSSSNSGRSTATNPIGRIDNSSRMTEYTAKAQPHPGSMVNRRRRRTNLVPIWRRFFTKNSDLGPRTHSGRIRPVGGLVYAEGRTLWFACGAVVEHVDVVIRCTGFRPDLSFLCRGDNDGGGLGGGGGGSGGDDHDGGCGGGGRQANGRHESSSSREEAVVDGGMRSGHGGACACEGACVACRQQTLPSPSSRSTLPTSSSSPPSSASPRESTAAASSLSAAAPPPPPSPPPESTATVEKGEHTTHASEAEESPINSTAKQSSSAAVASTSRSSSSAAAANTAASEVSSSTACMSATCNCFPRCLYHRVFAVEDPTLCFVGFARPVVGSISMMAEWHAYMVARTVTGKGPKLPPVEERRRVADAERRFWEQYFRFDGAKRRPLLELSVHLRSLVANGLLPAYRPIRACRSRGLKFALMHAIVPLNNCFLYFDDTSKQRLIDEEYANLHELESWYNVAYTLVLHGLLFLPSLPLAILYYSVEDPRYIWEWWCGSITGRLRPTPTWFLRATRTIAIFLYTPIIALLLYKLVSASYM